MSSEFYPTQAPLSQSTYDTYPGQFSDGDPYSAFSNLDAFTCENPQAEQEIQALLESMDPSYLDWLVGFSAVDVQPTVPSQEPQLPPPESAPALQPTVAPALQPTVAPTHHSVPAQSKAEHTINAMRLFEANVRYNPNFRTTGLLSLDEIDLEGEMAREAEMEARGMISFTQATWEEAIQCMGRQEFLMYYHEQVERARRNNWNLAPLPDWIVSYCFPKQTAPAPAAVTSQTVAQQLLNRGGSGRVPSSRKAARTQRQAPYPRQ